MSTQIFRIDQETFEYHLKQAELIFNQYNMRSQFNERFSLYEIFNKTRANLFDAIFKID